MRRFDVFAEYNTLEAPRAGRRLDEAKGHGLWVAKVVASRRFGSPRGYSYQAIRDFRRRDWKPAR